MSSERGTLGAGGQQKKITIRRPRSPRLMATPMMMTEFMSPLSSDSSGGGGAGSGGEGEGGFGGGGDGGGDGGGGDGGGGAKGGGAATTHDDGGG